MSERRYARDNVFFIVSHVPTDNRLSNNWNDTERKNRCDAQSFIIHLNGLQFLADGFDHVSISNE